MANIKQKTTFTSLNLTDIVYLVQGVNDGNTTLESIKDFFNIGDVEEWQTQSIANGTTKFINIEDSTIYGAIELDYIAKRSGRGQRTGKITFLIDDSTTSGVKVSDYYLGREDGDDLGLTLDNGRLSSGTIQLDAVADASDANPVVFNYQIISKRPLTV